MKVFAISDPHLSFDTNKPMDIFGERWTGHWEEICADWKARVADTDVVLIAGDISWAMKPEEARRDLEAISKNCGTKILIRGNHDYWWQSYGKVNELLNGLGGMKAIQNNAIEIGDYIFCGTRGWFSAERGQILKDEDQKIYDREAIRLRLALSDAKKLQAKSGHEIIALMHYPPFNNSFEPTPYTNLFSEFGVKTVVFGHIHGRAKYPAEIKIDGTRYLLTSCDYLCNKLKEII